MKSSPPNTIKQSVLESTPIVTVTAEPTPDKTTVDVHYGDCLGITNYSKVAGKMRGEITARREDLGYRLEGKSSYDRLQLYPTKFKIIPSFGAKYPFPRRISFGQRVGNSWQEIEQIDLPPWMSVEHCGYNVKFTVVGDGVVILTGEVRVSVWSTE